MVGLEHAMGQLNVEQPVIDISRPRPIPIEKKASLRLFAEDSMLHRELSVRDFDLLNAVERHCLECLPKLARRIVPEDDSVF